MLRNKKINPNRMRQLTKTISIILIIGSTIFMSIICVNHVIISLAAESYEPFKQAFYQKELLFRSEVKGNNLEFNPEKKKRK